MPFSLYGDLSSPTSYNKKNNDDNKSTKPAITSFGLYDAISGPGVDAAASTSTSPASSTSTAAATTSTTNVTASAITPSAATPPVKPAGWSAYKQFRPVMRKPTIQAKPKLNRPVIPAGATIVSETVVTKDQATSNDTIFSEKTSSPSPLPPPPPSMSVKIDALPFISTADDVNGFRAVQQSKKKGKKKGKKNDQAPPPMDMNEDYDPQRPNDYEQYKEERKLQREARRREQLQRRRADRSRSRSRSRSLSPYSDRSYNSRSPSPRSRRVFAPPPELYQSPSRPSLSPERRHTSEDYHMRRAEPARINLDESADDAYARRANLAKMNLNESAEDAYARRAQLSQGPVNDASRHMRDMDDRGMSYDMPRRVLTKYGWQDGQGLGRDEDGMSEALQVQATGRGSGRIMHPSQYPKPSSFSQPMPPAPPPSQVILLTNMVGPGEVDEMLQEETAEECAKYGKVERCLIFEVANGQVPDEEAVRIFIKFTTKDAAQHAITDLDGRYFGGRVVFARFYDCDKFDRLQLAPSPEEVSAFRRGPPPL
ncbi:uncharacterized protein BYT42DRAFT_570742 [Radiomyces spectabilis]|uniref:uncharacterized protein n=1 Tax=Radiomyces spectabilis TaxID=64574 RepID=UPI00221F01FE|nr:uncharacterized protein BYT42DRAFT_570742 [Radiomyces spectabilis]KAI8377564.1 hypothetical protein BYT42DRAFT_570742 [Radiomyces spectabilis]